MNKPTLAFLLLLLPAALSANPVRTVSSVGSCRDKVEQAVAIVSHDGGEKPVDLWVVCRSEDWQKLMAERSLSQRTAAFTIIEKSVVVIGPLAFPELRFHILHELKHVKCSCSLGETVEH